MPFSRPYCVSMWNYVQVCLRRPAPSTLRDTCVYSIIAAEWPTVKAHLAWQLTKPRE